MWKSLLCYTPSEKRGMLDGINLFFGALLGTNLGSVTSLSMPAYGCLIFVLAGTVMSLRIFSSTERRWHGYLLLGLYSVLVLQFLFASKITSDVALADRQRLAITLGIWLLTVIIAEITPTQEPPAKELREGGRQSPAERETY